MSYSTDPRGCSSIVSHGLRYDSPVAAVPDPTGTAGQDEAGIAVADARRRKRLPRIMQSLRVSSCDRQVVGPSELWLLQEALRGPTSGT